MTAVPAAGLVYETSHQASCNQFSADQGILQNNRSLWLKQKAQKIVFLDKTTYTFTAILKVNNNASKFEFSEEKNSKGKK